MYRLDDLSAIDLAEPLSPELVLVTPGLRAVANRRLPPPPSPSTPRTPPVDGSPLRTLCGTVEVTARVPVVLTLAVWAAIAVARSMVIVGGPVVLLVTLATLLGH